MKITGIDVTTLVFAYAPEKRFRYAGGVCTHRLTSLVQVRTDTGAVGIGCAYSHPDIVRTVIEGHLAPHLIGRDPTEVEALWLTMYRQVRWYGRKGAAVSALGALDIAFWDLRGKAEGKTVRALLGASRDTVPAYASALLWANDLAGLAREAEAHRARGFHRMKMRLGRGPEYDVPALDAARRGAGRGAQILVDGSMRYGVEDAARLAAELEARDVLWFEEPFEPEDIDSYTALQRRTIVPLAAGENDFTLTGFREMLRAGAIGIAQADASRCGGITEAYQVGILAAKHGARLAPHSWSDAVAIIANAQVVAALDNAITVEVDQTGNPFVDALLGGPLVIRDGLLHLPAAPGLGIELDQSVLDRHRWPAGRPLPPGAYSDMDFADPAGPARAPLDDPASATWRPRLVAQDRTTKPSSKGERP